MTDDLDSRGRDSIRVAEHVILHQLVDLYPAHVTLEELTGIVVDRRISANDVQDALRNLVAQRLVHCQESYYWLQWERHFDLAPLRNFDLAPPCPTRGGLFELHVARAGGGRQGWDHEWRRSSR